VLFLAKLQPRDHARRTESVKDGKVGYGLGLDQPPFV